MQTGQPEINRITSLSDFVFEISQPNNFIKFS